jgi:hypothetical protein
MQPLPAPWTLWWQGDLPCRFSPEDAARNRDFLVDLIGREWLQNSLVPLSAHPLISEWMTNGCNGFLLLNALAEDARLLQAVSGFDQILKDPCDGELCKPTWHLIRGAAMFRRAGVSVTEFYKQTDKAAPDFSVRFNSVEANVEAKLLVDSDLEEMFGQFGERLYKKIFAEALSRESIHPLVTVIFKNVGDLADPEDIVSSATALLRDPRPAPKEFRTKSFNVFADLAPAGEGLYRGCNILCPRSEKENLRVANRVSKASQQLLSGSASEHPGILWLGLTRHQDAVFLRDQLQRSFDSGRHAGISQAFLLLSGTHLEPPRRTVADYGALVANPNSARPLSTRIPVKPLELNGDLLALHGADRGLSAYRVGAVQVRVGPGMPQLILPDFRRVDGRSLA